MIIRLVLALDKKRLQDTLARHFAEADVWVEAVGHLPSPWQRVIRSCGDIIVISHTLIPEPVDGGIVTINDLPESPTSVIVHDGPTADDHASLVAAGADAVLDAGVAPRALIKAIESIIESRQNLMESGTFPQQERERPRIDDFLIQSDVMEMFIKDVRQIVSSNTPLLLMGETGVGKEHLARAIHAEGSRVLGPFVAINTAALPEQLLESELFGHTQGAFTGAARARRGAFEQAHRGTLFLDEISEMPFHLQAKLLRALQDYEIRPLGSETSVWVDVRVVASTNRDLEEEVEQGRFRRDLYYRLSVIALKIPPLRERKEDIPEMANAFLRQLHRRVGRETGGFTEFAMQALCDYDWPGNVRELMNVIERAILLCRGEQITPDDLPHSLRSIGSDPTRSNGRNPLEGNWQGKTLQEVYGEVLDYVDRKYLEGVLRDTKGRVGEAARRAGIHPRGLYDKMKRLGLRKEAFRKP